MIFFPAEVLARGVTVELLTAALTTMGGTVREGVRVAMTGKTGTGLKNGENLDIRLHRLCLMRMIAGGQKGTDLGEAGEERLTGEGGGVTVLM